ncbi:MAG TPA: tetratricopeptide repeat protein [Planctomycetota bacterium]|nr:tetratricopeptide repeat protein [Planctomycetota bacterium]
MNPLQLHGVLALVALLLGAVVPSKGGRALETGLALALPIAGPAAVIVQRLVELVLARLVRSCRPEDLTPKIGIDLDPVPDPVDELRIGLAAAPVEEVLESGEPDRVEPMLQRLVRRGTPEALRSLVETLRRPDRALRVRARGLIVRLEDQLVRKARTSKDPVERGRAFLTLATLAVGPSAARYATQAAEAFEAAARRDPGGAGALELSRLRLDEGRTEEACRLLDEYVTRNPSDPEGYLARAEARARAGRLSEARLDAAFLSHFGGRYEDLARAWSELCTSA